MIVARSRPAGSQRFYSSAYWQKVRAQVRREQPICQRCWKQNRLTPSQSVHHLDNDFRNNESSNLEALCNACHFSISGVEHNLQKKDR
ncbi:MAG: HNH endonuclease [Gemmatimonadaceae bacterium]